MKALTIALLILTALVREAVAQDFYAGKTINLIVGYSAGGGYDQYARLLARHFGRYIPGHPNIVVQNMPGAATLTAVRALSVNAPRDGTAITMFDPGLILESLSQPERFKVSFSDYQWIGGMSREVTICYAWHATGIKTFKDMLAPQGIPDRADRQGLGGLRQRPRAAEAVQRADPPDRRLSRLKRAAHGGGAWRAGRRLRVLERDPAGLDQEPARSIRWCGSRDAARRHAAHALHQRPRKEPGRTRPPEHPQCAGRARPAVHHGAGGAARTGADADSAPSSGR